MTDKKRTLITPAPAPVKALPAPLTIGGASFDNFDGLPELPVVMPVSTPGKWEIHLIARRCGEGDHFIFTVLLSNGKQQVECTEVAMEFSDLTPGMAFSQSLSVGAMQKILNQIERDFGPQ